MTPIAHLDEKMQNVLTGLIEESRILLGDNLLSIYLYGSAAGKGYAPERSNLNTLLLLNKMEFEALRGISGIYKKRVKMRIVAPLVLTPDYIRTSTDVFPIEFLDIKENSILLAGADILKEISIDLSCLREQCEREIKGQMVRFRGSFLEVDGDKKGMERLVATAISTLVYPLKNILRLMNQEIPEGGEATIRGCCKTLNVRDTQFLEAWGIKSGARKSSLESLYSLISGYMSAIEEISCKIDGMKTEGKA